MFVSPVMKNMLTVLVLICLLAPVSQAQEYTVPLEREFAVGEVYQLSVSGSRSYWTANRLNEEVVDEMRFSVEGKVVGNFEVTRVSEKGTILAAELTVSAFEAKVNDQVIEFEPNQAVLLTRSEGSVVARDDQGNDMEPTLSMVFGSLCEGAIGEEQEDLSADQIFGFDQPRAIGVEWEGDKEGFLKYFTEQTGFQVDPNQVFLKAELIELTEIAGEEALSLSNSTSVFDYSVPDLVEAGMKMGDSHVIVTQEFVVPTRREATSQRVRVKVDMKYSGALRNEEGNVETSAMAVQVDIEQELLVRE